MVHFVQVWNLMMQWWHSERGCCCVTQVLSWGGPIHSLHPSSVSQGGA